MYSTKVLGDQSGPLHIHHSAHKAKLKAAIKAKKQLPHGPKKK